MNRRKFIKRGGLLVPASIAFPSLLLPRKTSAAIITRQMQSIIARKKANAGGGGGCSTAQTGTDDVWSGTSEGTIDVGNESANQYVATYFQGYAYEPCSMHCWLEAVGSPTFGLIPHIYDQSSDLPNNSLGEGDEFDTTGMAASETEITLGGITGVGTLSGSAYYYRVLEVVGSPDSENYVKWHFITGTYPFFSMTVHSSTGTSGWTQVHNAAQKSQNYS